MKKNVVLLLSFLLSFLSLNLFVSCKSLSSFIPGQNKVLIENLYKEYINLGNAYFEIEKYSDAIKYYEKALESESLNKIAYYKISQCYVFSEKWESALPMYEKMLEDDKDNLSLKASIAYIYSMTGDFDNALVLYEDLISAFPENLTYIENYLAIILGNKDVFNSNKDKFETKFQELKDEYPKNENISLFQKKYDDYVNKEEASPDTKTES